jgi:hypothetical protein
MNKRTFALSLCFLALCLSLVVASSAGAQNVVKFSALEIDLWPEFDRPDILVIYRITLSPDVRLPAEVTLRIPTEAGEPNAVAARQADGGLFTITYNRQVDGEWALVTFTATMPDLQLEYYDPRLARQGGERSFEYRWPGDYAVDSLSIQVQQPVESSEMRISPALDPGVTSQDGLVYHNKQVGSLAEGEPFSIRFSYQKSTDTLSTKGLPVEPSAPLDSATDLAGSLRAALPWVLGALGVILIVGGGWWYWQSGRGQDRPETRRRRRPAAARETVPAEGHIYCHNCGKRAASGDRFCRTCGTKLRLE